MMKKKYNKANNTWIIDLDGTIIFHNSHLKGENVLLKNVKNFWNSIHSKDKIILVTNRDKKYKRKTINFLVKNNLRFDHIIFEAGSGQRILINDTKPDGLKTAFGFSIKRNEGFTKIFSKIQKFLRVKKKKI